MTSKINTDLPEFETLKRFLSEEREAYKKHYNIENSEVEIIKNYIFKLDYMFNLIFED